MHLSHFAVRFQAFFAALILAAAGMARGDGSALAPLVNSNTSAVLRISCRNVDLNALVQVTVKVANKTIDAVIKDPKTAKQAKSSLPLLIAGYMSGLVSLCDSYKEAGLDDIYFVVTPENDTSLGFFAVPLGNIPEEKVEGLKKGLLSLRSLNLPLPFCFERHGYLFAPVTNLRIEEDRLKEQIRDQFDRLNPEPRPDIEEALTEFPQAAAALVITGNENSSKILASSIGGLQNNPGADGAKTVLDKMNRLGEAARYGTLVFDQSDTSIKLRIRFRPGFDPAPTVADLRAQLLKDNRSEDENATLRESLINAVMPDAAPGTLDWKIDEAYVQKNMPVIQSLCSAYREKQEKHRQSPPAGGSTPSEP